jgi:hypothetical protein
LVLSPTGSIYLGFITEGRLAAVLITPCLGVPNWSVIYINTAPSTSFLAPLPGIEEEEAPTSTTRQQNSSTRDLASYIKARRG